MNVLGFDPSLTNFGYAVYGTDPIIGGRFQTSSKTLFIDRYVDLRGKVRSIVQEHQIKRVGIEYPVFGEQYSPGLYGLFLFTCEALKAEKCDVVFFSPGQAKAQARDYLKRPKGWKMNKPDMVEATQAITGKRLNHNVADAYWIGRTASRFWDFLDGVVKKENLSELEQKQFAGIHTFSRGKRAGETVQSGILYREDERFFRWSQENDNGEEQTQGN